MAVPSANCSDRHCFEQESKEMLTDILGRLEEIQSSLETAESDQEACRRGIRAADEALKLTSDDPDVKSDIRMKRAQLLYIAVSLYRRKYKNWWPVF